MKPLLFLFLLCFSTQAQEPDWLIKPILDFDDVKPFKEGLAEVEKNKKHGFIDKTGKVVVPIEYDDAISFSEGLASVKKNNKWGFVDKTEKLVIPLEYDNAGVFSEGLASVKKNDKWGFIDKTGKVVIPLEYDFVFTFSEGTAGVKKNGKWGFIDKTGDVVVAIEYDFVFTFSEGLATVRKAKKLGFIDKTGKVVIPLKYHAFVNPIGIIVDKFDTFSEGTARVANKGKWGFINKTGNIVVPIEYDQVGHFSEGLVWVGKGGKYGLIDKTGKVVIPIKYDDAWNLSEGLSGVKKNGKWGFIDKAEKVVVPLEYDYVDDFSEGLAWVKKDGKWGIIKNPLLTQIKEPEAKTAPTFTWLSAQNTVNQANYILKIQISHPTELIGQVQFYQNGKLHNNRDMFMEEATTTQTKTKTHSQNVVLAAGANSFYATATLVGQAYTSPTISINYTPPTPTPIAPVLPKEKRLALVVGNANYTASGQSLPNPINDARAAMERSLKELGFEVLKIEDASHAAFKAKVNEFVRTLKNYDVGLFYYAGHGVEIDRYNYMMPSDVPRKDDFSKADVPDKCVSSDWVQRKMAKAGEVNKSYIVILDACRNNPFTRSWRSFSSENIWSPNQAIPSGFITCFSASQGEKASDGVNGNGLFTSTLLKYMKTPNMEIEDLFKRVRLELRKQGIQEPEYTPKLNQDFYFVR